VVCGAVTTLAGSTMCSTMLSDLYSGAALRSERATRPPHGMLLTCGPDPGPVPSRAYATLGSAAGAGAVFTTPRAHSLASNYARTACCATKYL
jgi:hypothetical protein